LKLIHGLPDQHAAVAPSVLTIGNFDGVHRGHRRIIAAARASARADNLPVVALTFEPHPLSILRPDRAPDG
jgi:riboflavin kinase/FMN adenylyltransferase